VYVAVVGGLQMQWLEEPEQLRCNCSTCRCFTAEC